MELEQRLELLRLLSAQCDEQLEDAEHARLEQLLSSDAEARQIYLQYVDMHARLLVHPRVVDESLPLGSGHGVAEADPFLARLAVTRKTVAEAADPHWRHTARQVVPYLAVIA